MQKIWDNDCIIPKQRQYFGKSFKAEQGVRQGDIISPTLFNIMLDAVIREYNNTARIDNTAIIQFYADNGFIASPDHRFIQHTLNALLHNFSSFGLCINTTKTESMTMLGSKLTHRISDTAYTRMITRIGPTCDGKKNKNKLYKLWIGGSNQVIKTTPII
jgi:retron-type reverse transcriptase